MEPKEYEAEVKKLEEVVKKLAIEEKLMEERLGNTSGMYKRSDGIREELLHMAEKKLKELKAIHAKPYFARLDFKEQGKEIEKLYIGKLSMLDSRSQEPIIVDWRAPIANLYYEGRPGKASYQCLAGEIAGEITLKRQYFIEHKKLDRYVDIDVSGNDELLQNAISEKADDRLKNIVATIQEEQNAIIRAPMNIPLIVQGVAGSGKTTIALHRIAYLIYHYETQFNPEDFMIIAPNKFFLNYISNILPDLGVENVRQYTFENFAYEVIGKKLKIADSNEKLVTIVNKEFDSINKGNIDIMIEEAKLKSSLKFKQLIEMYIKQLEEGFMPKQDFKIEGYCVLNEEELQTLFVQTYQRHDFDRRIFEIKKHMHSELKKKAPFMIEALQKERRGRIEQLETLELGKEETTQRRIAIFEEYETRLAQLEKVDKKLVNDYFKEVHSKDCLSHYHDFILQYFKEETPLACYLKENTIKNLCKKEIAFEDLAPLLYIHYKTHGVSFRNTLRHIVIDEAQDYGAFQFDILKTILNSNAMTILGDIAQGVHYYRGIEDWKSFQETAFPDVTTKYQTLTKTYRTTKEIMDKANLVISKLSNKEGIVLGEPVIQGKDSIFIQKQETPKEIVQQIQRRIEIHKKQGYQSIAIIGKDQKECEYVKKEISHYRQDVTLIKSKDSQYNAGISIVPSYLAKGLEFDVVIIFNANQDNYTHTDLDIKLLYVTITRAMSKLDIFYTKEITSLLN